MLPNKQRLLLSRKASLTLTTSLIYVFVGFGLLLVSCDPRHNPRVQGDGPTPKALAEHENRFTDYRKSHLFDQKTGIVAQELGRWNNQFVQAIENQGSGDRLPLVFNPIDLVFPILKESKRGFFRKTSSVWVKEIPSTEKLSIEKEISLERLNVELADTKSRHFPERESSWTIRAMGRYPKDQIGELLVIRWNGLSRFLEIESSMTNENRFKCSYKFSETGVIKRANCNSLVLYRVSNKDVVIDRLTYDEQRGFSGEGRVVSAKVLNEKGSEKNADKVAEKESERHEFKGTHKPNEKMAEKTVEKTNEKWTLGAPLFNR